MPTENPSDGLTARKKSPDTGNQGGLHVWAFIKVGVSAQTSLRRLSRKCDGGVRSNPTPMEALATN
jgi:hypothetical protein